MPYTPSHIRRQKAEASHLERENAELRRRLSDMHHALQLAHTQMKEVGQWQAYIEQAADEVSKRMRIATAKLRPDVVNAALERERSFLEARYQQENLYVADRRYSRRGEG